MRNLPEFVVSFWGAALTGAIVVPLNSWWTGGELTYALRERRRRRSCSPTTSGSNGSWPTAAPRASHLVGVRTDGGDVPFDELTER